MISNRRGWHYFAVKKFWIIKKSNVKHDSDFYCLNCLHSFTTKNELELHKKVCQNIDFCSVEMPFEDTKLLEFNQYQKSDKAPFVIYADFTYFS